MNVSRMVFIVLLMICQVAGAESALAASTLAPVEVRRWQQDKSGFYLVDVRSGSAYSQKHIEGALNIPAFIVAKKGLPKGGAIVLYDNGIGTTEARSAAEKLESSGYGRVYILDGGLARWEAAGLPMTAPRGVLDGKLVEPVSAGELVQAQRDGMVLVVIDLRAVASFKAGTIPGARNVAPSELETVATGWRKDDLVVLVDGGDGESERQAEVLRRTGFKLVRFLYGGFPEWKRQSKS